VILRCLRSDVGRLYRFGMSAPALLAALDVFSADQGQNERASAAMVP
jgi:hypothetical protein